MSAKGAITISQDELARMKMRANLIPSCNFTLIKLIQKKIAMPSSINKVKSALTNGLTT